MCVFVYPFIFKCVSVLCMYLSVCVCVRVRACVFQLFEEELPGTLQGLA